MAVLNKKETAIAQGKQELLKEAFSEWIWKDPERREKICKAYNILFNSNRPREYDGSHINFSGMNPEITLRKHQVNAIAHILYGGNTLLAMWWVRVRPSRWWRRPWNPSGWVCVRNLSLWYRTT